MAYLIDSIHAFAAANGLRSFQLVVVQVERKRAVLLRTLSGMAAGHRLRTWRIGRRSELSLGVLLSMMGFARLISAQVTPTVTVNNLTHPDMAPSFLAGDSYQYIVVGEPNEPVYNVQNSGPMAQVGQTDASGNFQTNGVEQAAWAGNYAQT